MPAASAQLHLRRDGRIAVISGGGPLDDAFAERLAGICGALDGDEEARAVLLDLAPAAWGGAGGAPEPGDPFGPLAALPQPTVAAIASDCTGPGLELALCADVRAAAPGARFGLPALLDGGFCAAGGLQRLTRAIGRSRATQLALTGELLDAERARAWGLISAVADDPAAEARRLAEAMAERGPIALRYAKEAMLRGAEMPLAQALQYETELTMLLQATADRAEGVAAFVEKRAPAFRGA